jgi:hypothetical protein
MRAARLEYHNFMRYKRDPLRATLSTLFNSDSSKSGVGSLNGLVASESVYGNLAECVETSCKMIGEASLFCLRGPVGARCLVVSWSFSLPYFYFWEAVDPGRAPDMLRIVPPLPSRPEGRLRTLPGNLRPSTLPAPIRGRWWGGSTTPRRRGEATDAKHVWVDPGSLRISNR